MSSFLSNITKRHFGQVPLVTARKRALFETNRFTEAPTSSIEEESMLSNRMEETDSTNNSALEVASDRPIPDVPITRENPLAESSLGELVQKPTKDKTSKTISDSDPKRTLLTANASNSSEPAINSDKAIGDPDATVRTSSIQKHAKSTLLTINNSNLPKASPSIHHQTMIIQNEFEQSKGDTNASLPVAPAQLPNVKIHIGKIEVKAAPEKTNKSSKPKKRSSKPKLSLEQYLKNQKS